MKIYIKTSKLPFFFEASEVSINGVSLIINHHVFERKTINYIALEFEKNRIFEYLEKEITEFFSTSGKFMNVEKNEDIITFERI